MASLFTEKVKAFLSTTSISISADTLDMTKWTFKFKKLWVPPPPPTLQRKLADKFSPIWASASASSPLLPISSGLRGDEGPRGQEVWNDPRKIPLDYKKGHDRLVRS